MANTLSNVFNHVSNSLVTLNQELARVQEQTATGSRINHISDSPSDTYRLLNLTSEQNTLDNYVSNVTEIMEMFETTSLTLDAMADELDITFQNNPEPLFLEVIEKLH